jgi:hypothetical protein
MEFLMSFKTKIAAFALASLAVTGSLASTTQAEAKPFFHHGFGLGAALFTAAVVGTAIAASNDGYNCGYVRQYDAYGNYIGRVRTCN